MNRKNAKRLHIYYNYRHYNPLGGRWTGRDANEERSGYNLFTYVKGTSLSDYDILGLGTKVVYSPISVACSCGVATSLTLSASLGISIGLRNIKGVSFTGTISLTIPLPPPMLSKDLNEDGKI